MAEINHSMAWYVAAKINQEKRQPSPAVSLDILRPRRGLVGNRRRREERRALTMPYTRPARYAGERRRGKSPGTAKNSRRRRGRFSHGTGAGRAGARPPARCGRAARSSACAGGTWRDGRRGTRQRGETRAGRQRDATDAAHDDADCTVPPRVPTSRRDQTWGSAARIAAAAMDWACLALA